MQQFCNKYVELIVNNIRCNPKF